MIAVFGHKNPDTDTICAAIVYSTFLNDTGKSAQAYALGKPNNETKFVLTYRNITTPEIISSLPAESHVVLVDHNQAGQSIDSRDDLIIDAVIDHHNVGDFATGYPLMMRLEPVGCACTILYHIFEEKNYTPSKEMAGLMISSILSDTIHFRSQTTTPEDKEAVEALNKIAHIDDLAAYALDMFTAKGDLGDMPIEEILKLDYKTFDMSGKNIGYGVMETTNPGYGLMRKDELLGALATAKAKDGLDYIFFSIIDIIKEQNFTIVLGEAEAKALDGAFGAGTTDHLADLGNRMSRKKQMIPQLEEYFQNIA